jgi:sarcosine oxidase, subunit gamma
MLDHQEPFDALRSERLGCYLADQPGLRMTISSAGFLLLQSRREAALQDALAEETGLRLPAPQQVCTQGNYALLWLTPTEWLLELPAEESLSLRSALARRLTSSVSVANDISDAFACCQVNGRRAAEVLMSGCSLDLRSSAFHPGRVACTVVADVPAILWKTGEPNRFRCLFDRSFAAHIRNWLRDATRGDPRESRPMAPAW